MSVIPYETLITYIEKIGAVDLCKIRPMGEDQVKICCPFHDDENPSGVITISTAKFHCKTSNCGRRTDLATTLAAITTIKTGKPCNRNILLDTLVRKFGLKPEGDAALASEPILLAYKELIGHQGSDLAKAFFAKGISLDSVKRYKIGMRDGRIIIPILDEYGLSWVDERRYLPNAPGAEKMRNVPGRGKSRLFPIDQLQFDSLVICGGECKAIVASQQLNVHGIGAICVTGAEGTWDTEWNKYLHKKKVYICLDIDNAGKAAAQKLAHYVYKPAEEVVIVALPLDDKTYPKGDINNFIHDESGDLYNALLTCGTDYAPKLGNGLGLDEGEYLQRSISQSIEADNVGSRSAVDVTVIGLSEQRYSLPKTVKISCGFDNDECGTCNVYGKQKNPRFTVPVEHPSIISMCDSSDKEVASTLRHKIIGIPEKCKKHVIVVEERYGAEIAVVSQPVGLESTSANDARHVQKALLVCDGVELNATLRVYTRAQPDPRTQETVLLTGHYDKLLDALDTADQTGNDSLEAFKPVDNSLEALEAKLAEIAEDLSCNVTNIYQRSDMHRVIDLVSHSPIGMTLEGTAQKGYIEALIIGDTGQGKSDCTKKLSKHYGAGHTVDGATVSVAGLIGGNQQLAGMWVTTWGALPANDRKWLIWEEVKRTPVEVLSALTETRSSGIARISKIRAGSRMARVRLLGTSNTRSDRFLRTYGSGVDAVLELIGQPEDVRRFDLCYAVSADDIEGDVIHAATRPTAKHIFTSSLCHRLLTWVWTREARHVVFSPEVKDVLFEKAQGLSTDYVDTVPIVDRGTIRLKLARIAASTACRTYSTDDGENVLIQIRHVLSAYNFLKSIYDGDAMGYKRYSERHKATAHMGEAKSKAVIKAISNQPYAATVAEYLSTRTFVNEKELAMLGCMSPEDCKTLLGVLLRNGGIEYKGNNVIITGALRETLRKVSGDVFTNGDEY